MVMRQYYKLFLLGMKGQKGVILYVILINAGCSLGMGDQRIFFLLCRILRLTIGSLWLFFIQTWEPLSKYSPATLHLLLLIEFLLKTLYKLLSCFCLHFPFKIMDSFDSPSGTGSSWINSQQNLSTWKHNRLSNHTLI